MKVDKHINELLYEHDCVIVPQLGGFVANYASAKIHPTQHTFNPPSKNIVFNKNLITNDGLLANHIAVAESTSYPEALRYINNFVAETRSELGKGLKIKVDAVGTLYLDVEHNLQFEQGTTNYLLEAFGLAEFQSPAIKQDTISKRIEKEFKDRSALPNQRKKIAIKRYVAIAFAIPLIVGMLWIPFKTDLLNGLNYSNLNPFPSKEASKLKERNLGDAKKVEAKDFTTTTLPNENDTSKVNTLKLTENSGLPVTANMLDKRAIEVAPDTTKVVMSNAIINTGFKFHLVTGCFQVHDNAINFVKSLQQQNINAAIIGQNKDGFYVVSCGDYASQREASGELQQLRKIKPDAWLYKN